MELRSIRCNKLVKENLLKKYVRHARFLCKLTCTSFLSFVIVCQGHKYIRAAMCSKYDTATEQLIAQMNATCTNKKTYKNT